MTIGVLMGAFKTRLGNNRQDLGILSLHLLDEGRLAPALDVSVVPPLDLAHVLHIFVSHPAIRNKIHAISNQRPCIRSDKTEGGINQARASQLPC